MKTQGGREDFPCLYHGDAEVYELAYYCTAGKSQDQKLTILKLYQRARRIVILYLINRLRCGLHYE